MTDTLRRHAAVTFRGRPVTLLGPRLQVGDPAPDFTVLANDFSPVTLAATAGVVRVFSVVPSLDTEVCDQQARRFNLEAAEHPGLRVLTVSVDLPFAQRRWCAGAGIDAAQTVSDHRELSFGLGYGVAIAEMRLLARAVFVVDADNIITHAQYVPEVAEHPDYTAALAAAAAA